MQNRSTGRIVVVAAIAVLSVFVVVTAATTERLPLVTHALETIASSVAAAASSQATAASQPVDAGVRKPDAGTVARKQTAPLSSAQLGAPLVHGSFVSACGAPDTMKVVVNVTVKMGRAVGVVVQTQPSDPSVAACIERAARELQWDVSPKTDHVTVTY